MTRPLFQLGSFQFDLPNGAPQNLDRQTEFRWEEQDRLLREPAAQYLGPGSQTISLAGVLFPGFTGSQSTMETLRTLAGTGEPQMLTDGLGRVYGKWGIRRVAEQQQTFAPGGAARQIGFTLELVKYAEDNPGQAASPFSVQQGSALPANVTAAVGSFTGDGSSFMAVDWPINPQFSATSLAAQGAGFNIGQLASIARTVGNGDYVGAALGAFGLAGLSVDQTNTWAQVGINGAQMVQAMANGQGPPSMSVALEALAPASAAVFSSLVPAEAVESFGGLVDAASTVSTILNVDPQITGAVRTALQL